MKWLVENALPAIRWLLMGAGSLLIGAAISMQLEKIGVPGPVAWKICLTIVVLTMVWVAK